MNTIIKKPYEISLWEDYQEEGIYKERQLAIIGSDKMDSPSRAQDPQLSQNINSVTTLTFSIFSKYYDTETNELIDNPYIGLLVNERKVKLQYDGQWYDFIIKSIQENSSDYRFTYTCQDLFVNELSKNGFSVEFHNDLQNNQGTVQELAARALEGTDWEVGESDLIQQKNEEPLYRITVGNNPITLYYNEEGTENSITVAANTVIYGYYSQIVSQTSYVQFVYVENGAYEVDSENIILNSKNYYIDNVVYDEDGKPEFASAMEISMTYRGERLVRSQLATFDPVTQRYVNIYEKDGRRLYGYSSMESVTPETVPNLIANAKDYIDTSGWSVSTNNGAYLNYFTYPEISSLTKEDLKQGAIKSYLQIHFGGDTSSAQTKGRLLNSGLYSNFQYLGEDGVSYGEKYVLRVAMGRLDNGEPKGIGDGNYPLRASIIGYVTDENGVIYNPQPHIISFNLTETTDSYADLNYYEAIAEFQEDQVIYDNNEIYYYQDPQITKQDLITGRSIIFDFKKQCILTQEEYNSLLLGNKPETFRATYRGPYAKFNKYAEENLSTPAAIKAYTSANIRNTTERFGIVFEVNWEIDNLEAWQTNRAIHDYLIADCQLFPFVASSDNSEEPIYPDEIDGIEYIVNNYFYESTNADDFIGLPPSKNVGATNADEIIMEYVGTDIPEDIIPIYDETCEKIRSIEISESNYFNIIQTLAETFECWAKIEVEHEQNGKISLTPATIEKVTQDIVTPGLDWTKICSDIIDGVPNYIGETGNINISKTYYQVTETTIRPDPNTGSSEIQFYSYKPIDIFASFKKSINYEENIFVPEEALLNSRKGLASGDIVTTSARGMIVTNSIPINGNLFEHYTLILKDIFPETWLTAAAGGPYIHYYNNNNELIKGILITENNFSISKEIETEDGKGKVWFDALNSPQLSNEQRQQVRAIYLCFSITGDSTVAATEEDLTEIQISSYALEPDIIYYRDIESLDSEGNTVITETIVNLAEDFPVNSIIYTKENVPGHQIKRISFHEYVGKDNYAGFKYGVNLESIQRNLISDQIVSKIIVKANNNEFAKNGYCTISRSQYNPTKESFLLNFGYYINQGLLNSAQVTNDLYTTGNPALYIGYYGHLNRIGTELEQINEEREVLVSGLDKLNASLIAYQEIVDQSNVQIEEIKNFIRIYAGAEYDQIFNNENFVIEDYSGNNEIKNYLIQLANYQKNVTQYQVLVDQYTSLVKQYQERIDNFDDDINKLVEEKAALNQQFYLKYSRFIQEGTWTSEGYIDDDLYYLDAESVLYTSSNPQVQYTINVLELSQLDGYENYNFTIGDRTYIEDVDFFGYTIKAGIRTPYQEEIVVSELNLLLDSPEKNTVTVQNYKTQFEDLFQRITASVQSLEYKSGAYERAADAITSSNEIDPDLLQNSLLNNDLIIQNAVNESVSWDNTGITIVDIKNPNEMLRIVSGGILLTTDGGLSWSTGISGNGINTNFLTAGQIDATRINIRAGSFASFRWDSYGLNAFRFAIDDNGNPYNFDFGTFTRFDQYGLYGVQGNNVNFRPESTDEIKAIANFGMLWDGFFLKNKYGTHTIEISNTEDIVIKKNSLVEQTELTEEQFNLDKTQYYYHPTVYVETEVDSDTFANNPSNYYIRNTMGSYLQCSSGDTYNENETYYILTLDTAQYVQCGISSVYNEDTTYYAIGSEINLVQLGQISEGNFGLELKSIEGTPTLRAVNGQLWLSDSLFIAPNGFTEDNVRARFGIVSTEEDTENNTTVSKILSIMNPQGEEKIWIKDNGTASFEGVTVEGHINATSGTIGNIQITATGLDMNTGNIVVYGYLPAVITELQFDRNKTLYYYYDSLNENYIQCEDTDIYDETQQYYEYGIVYNLDGTTGEMLSQKGTFTGSITATGGTITGNLTIGSESERILLNGSGNNIGIQSSNYDPENSTGFYISTSGQIIANELQIGTKATIQNYLFLGTYNYEIQEELTKEQFDSNKTQYYYHPIIYTEITTNISDEFSTDPTKYYTLNDDGEYVQCDSSAIYDEDETYYTQNINEEQFIQCSSISEFDSNIDYYLGTPNGAFIYNPNSNNDKFISTTNGFLNFYADGKADFGSIKVNSNESTITAYYDEENNGYYWQLGPDYARFNNIDARGTISASKISTAIFEKQKTQIAGGYTLFKSAAFIRNISEDGLEIEVDPVNIFSDNDYIIIRSETSGSNFGFYQVGQVSTENNSITLIQSVSDDIKNSNDDLIIINLENEDSWIIGVNATSTSLSLGSNLASLPGNSLSMIKYEFNETGGLQSDYKLILGSLPDGIEIINSADIGTAGLYADTVYLRGSLVTAAPGINNTYAGVNTRSGIIFTQGTENSETDNSAIVFWAGAANTSDEAIQNAPFQVTEQGTLYASQGIFENSIFAGGTITAAEIRTAKITGTGEEGYGLIFQDLSNAIRFQTADGSSIFTLTDTLAFFDMNVCIGETITLEPIGNISARNISAGNYYIDRTGFNYSYEDRTTNTPTIYKALIDFTYSDRSIGFKIDNITYAAITSSQTNIYTNLYLAENIVYSESGEYKKAFDGDNNCIGYDLFIYEA